MHARKLPELLPEYCFDNRFPDKRFHFSVKKLPALENKRSDGTDVATKLRYFKAIFAKEGLVKDNYFHTCSASTFKAETEVCK